MNRAKADLHIADIVKQYLSGTSVRVLAAIHHKDAAVIRAALRSEGVRLRRSPWRQDYKEREVCI